MGSSNVEDSALPASNLQGCFNTTHWSVVITAKQGDTPEAAAAMERLCQTYWYPLYAFLRREGRSRHDAEDLTQEFFVRVLRGQFLENVSPRKGKFRSFLLTSLKHFLSDVWDKARAQKRGGGQIFIPLDVHNAEALYLLEPDTTATPDEVFEQRWALTVLSQALKRLREEFGTAGRIAEFDQLKVFLSTPTEPGAYNDLAVELGMAVDTLAVKVHRLRQRYGELIRAEISHTVSDEAEVEDELEHLFEVVGQ
jgi:RNA polymerase sigma factor (sigma-70 family)